MSFDLRAKATVLRKKGHLYSEIATQLGIAKSTAYVWTRSLRLSEDEAARIADRHKTTKLNHITHLAVARRLKSSQRDAELTAQAKTILEKMELTSDHKKLLCSVLFWCEGGKNVSAGLQFINSDPAMIQKFLGLLRESFSVTESRFRALVHLHEYHNSKTLLKYWSDITRIPLSQFHKPYIKPHTGKNTRDGYPGCISIRYLDTSLGRLLKAIYIEYSKSA